MYLLFDIGRTNMRLAVSKDHESFLNPVMLPTPKSFDAAMKTIQSTAMRLAGGKRIHKAIGGVAGVMDSQNLKLVASGIPGWRNKPLRRALESCLKAPILLENDTALVGLGEAVHGAARGYRMAAYITVSTGVGGVNILDGKIVPRATGYEPGYQIIDYKHPGKVFEDFVSGTGMKERYKKEAKEIKDPKAWAELASLLAVGLTNSIVHWSPEVVVLGGAMITGNPAISVAQVRREVKKFLVFNPPIIKKAVLKDWGGLYGALELAKQHV